VRAEHFFAGVPVDHLDAARAWYERLAGRPPDLVPNAREAAWHVSDSGWLCLIADPERAGSARHTILVEDLDAFIADAAERGIAAGPVAPVARDTRSVTIADPDGNRLQVGEVKEG